MDFVFLSARLPLTKTLVLRRGQLSGSPYPLVSRVTSYHESANTLEELYALLGQHAAEKRCLFGGLLDHPLVDESRAGKTLKRDREWIAFDFDKIDAVDHADVVKRYLPECCQNVSYIAQPSASTYRPDTTKWSGHLFMLLDTPKSEQFVRHWFEHLNFTTPALAAQITLSDSMQALHWPLDRTMAYNSRLIYIAPPVCVGFEPAVKQPFVLVKKRKAKLSIPDYPALDSGAVRAKINELRQAVGAPLIDTAVGTYDGHEIMLNASEVEIHGLKTSGDHFIRFNLNGGDSYAYYIDLRNPGIIRNFKGEPFLKTQDAAPELYKALVSKAKRAIVKPPLCDETEVLAFYATNQNSKIKIGYYNPVECELSLNTATETSARAWLHEHGLVQKAALPHMDILFDPTSNVQYVPGSTFINCFIPTKYMTQTPTNKGPSTILELPTVTEKILRSMLGNPKDEVLRHFMNWLAFVYQFREKTQTAWVLHGTHGTGKGTFVKYLLSPIFGREQVKVQQFSALNNEYNGFLDNSLFVVFEEADMASVLNKSMVDAKLRHWIADSPLSIRKMATDHYTADNYSNFFFMSNERSVVTVPRDDRRFNVADRQETRMFLTPNELQSLMEGAELPAFADILARWPVDRVAAHMVIHTEAREALHEASTSINLQIAQAIMAGDLQFFIERTPTEVEAASDFHNRFNPMGIYRNVLERAQKSAEQQKPILMTDEDLFPLFRTLIPDTRYFQDSKTWRRRHYISLGLDLSKQHRDGIEWKLRGRGLLVQWKMPESGLPFHDETNVSKIINPKKGTRAK